MRANFENQKLDWCKNELRALLERLIGGGYKTSAQTVFDHLAHSGVDTDLNPELKTKPTLDEFLKEK